MPVIPRDPVRLEMTQDASRSEANPAIRQKPAARSIGRWCSDLFQLGRSGSQRPELVQFRSYRPSSMAFSAKLVHGKVVAEGSQTGRDIAGQLNQLPGRLIQAPGFAASGQGLRMLDEKLNMFHVQSTPAVAAVFKSSSPMAGGALVPDNPGRAHLGQVSDVHTTGDGSQFRLIEQRLYRFEPQTCTWLADQDEVKYNRLGLTREGNLMKVPLGVSDMSVAGKTQASLSSGADGCTVQIDRDKGDSRRFTPVSERGEPVTLTRIGLAGDVLYASNREGELLRGDLRTASQGRLVMLPESIGQLAHLDKGAVSIKGFMHDDNAQLNVLLLDAHKQLHSSPLTAGAGLAPGWNLSDVLFKTIDKGGPQPGLRALANAVDLGQRGKVALEGNTLLCWDSSAQRWEPTEQINVDHLERGLDGRAYVLQEGQLKALATHKTREPVQMGASYDLAPPNGAQTRVTLDEVMNPGAGRFITGFAVVNARSFVSLDHTNQLHTHIDGKETPLTFSTSEDVQALALDHLGNLYAQTKTGQLLTLEKTQWQNPRASQVAWTPVQLPGNEQLKTLRMGADKHLVASWGDNHPQLNRWGETYSQLNISADGALQWQPLGAPSKAPASSLASVLSTGELKTQHRATSWAATSSVLGQTTEGIERDLGYFKGLSAHFKPAQGIKNIAHDLQHLAKGRAGMEGLYDSDNALRQQLKPLANAPVATLDLTTRLERLQGHQPMQDLVKELKNAVQLLEQNSELSALRLGDLRGAHAAPVPDKTQRANAGGMPGSTLSQMRKAFENLSPSTNNRTADLLRSYEQQGVVLSKWSADNKRDLKNPTALVESDLIHHAHTLSLLSQLTSRLEERDPDVTDIAASLKHLMQNYHDHPVHKKASQNINNYAQAEDLYKNFKLLAKDLRTPGSALHFHIARTLGVNQGGDVKQALMREVQQSDSGQSIASSRSISKSAGLLAVGIPPVPFLEFFIGASRGKTNGVTINRTDSGANIKINMDTKHALRTSIGAGLVPLSVGDALAAEVKLGVSANLSTSHEQGTSISLDLKEADFPKMMEILMGERGMFSICWILARIISPPIALKAPGT